jgi:hypothetical protein
MKFYPCTSSYQQKMVSSLAKVWSGWLYLFNFILDICFNEYATVASTSVDKGLTFFHWLDWEISGSIVLWRFCMREDISVQSCLPSTASPTAVTNWVARRMVC